MKNYAQNVDLSEVFQIRRSGKDLDPIFWHFGKVHGLENIAFASNEELLETGGNPVKLQKLVNKFEGRQRLFSSSEDLS